MTTVPMTTVIPVPVPMTRLTPDLTPGACPHG